MQKCENFIDAQVSDKLFSAKSALAGFRQDRCGTQGYELGAVGPQERNVGFLRAQLQGRHFPKLQTRPLASLRVLAFCSDFIAQRPV